MRKNITVFMVLSVGLSVVSHASLTWTGAGDGASLYQEANWLDDNGAVPAGGTVDPNVAISAATGGSIVIDSGAGTPSNYGGHFTLGTGNSLLVGGGKNLTGAPSSAGIRVDVGGGQANAIMDVVGGAVVYVQFVEDIDVRLDGGATLQLKGGANPLALDSTVDLLDTASVLQFDAETFADFAAEHINEVTYSGAALVFGSDPYVAEAGDNAIASAFNGASGIQIQAIPEPATLGMVALFGGTILFVRRKLTF